MQEITVESFQSEVVESEKPVVLDFYAPWCAPCKSLTPVMETLQANRPDISVCSVNVDTQHTLAEKYSISSLPTVVVCKTGGTVSKKMTGLTSAVDIERAIDESAT